MKLLVINACVRQGESRTLKIAEPIVSALSERYDIIRYDLPEMDGIVPLTPQLFEERGAWEYPRMGHKGGEGNRRCGPHPHSCTVLGHGYPCCSEVFFRADIPF